MTARAMVSGGVVLVERRVARGSLVKPRLDVLDGADRLVVVLESHEQVLETLADAVVADLDGDAYHLGQRDRLGFGGHGPMRTRRRAPQTQNERA